MNSTPAQRQVVVVVVYIPIYILPFNGGLSIPPPPNVRLLLLFTFLFASFHSMVDCLVHPRSTSGCCCCLHSYLHPSIQWWIVYSIPALRQVVVVVYIPIYILPFNGGLSIPSPLYVRCSLCHHK